MNMPGRSKKTTSDNQEGSSATSSDLPQPDVNQVGSSATMASSGTGSLDFTKALSEALKDPGVIKGFEGILQPMISSYVSETLRPFQDKIEDVESEVHVLSESLTDHKVKMSSQNEILMKRIRELERVNRSKNLRISGLSTTDVGTDNVKISTHERYLPLLRKVLDEAGIEGVADSDFSEIIRINIPNQTGPTNTILVKMVSETKRDLVYSQKNKLKNCTSRIYINEDLTKHDSKVFKRVRQEVKDGSLHSCWTKGGLVWAKTSQDSKPFPVPE